MDNYMAIFNRTSVALKSVHPGLRVGGPSSEQLGWVRELRQYTQQHGVAIDFLSTHQYPGDPHVPNTLSGHSDTIKEAVREAGDLPLLITEYSVGSHDDPSAAAGT